MSDQTWAPPGDHPYPPRNAQVVSPMFTGALDIRWDDPSVSVGNKATTYQQTCTFIQVTGVVETLQTATGSITVLTAPIGEGESVTVNGVELVSLAGARPAGSDAFDGSLGTPAAIAASIAEAINDGSLSGWGVVTAVANGSTVQITASEAGAAGNDISLATSVPGGIELSGLQLEGGQDPSAIEIGSKVLTAISTPRTDGSNEFTVGPSNFDTAASIAEAINDPANEFFFASATVVENVVTVCAAGIPDLKSSVLPVCTSSANIGISTGCVEKTNTAWTIVGVNVYRSDTGERGPYFRLNNVPVGGQFFRDYTDNILIEDEVVQWDTQWISKGDSSNADRWIFCTQRPISKRAGQAIHANSPADVTVKIDGVRVPVEHVFGQTGQITLVNQPTYDLGTEKMIPPLLPAEDGSSTVTVTYNSNRNLVKTDLETKAKIFYRLTTVAVDASKPSGYAETPLAWSPPLNVHQVESYDYIWREAVRRNTWILQQGGERVKLFIRRTTGVPCPCRRREQTPEYIAMPLNQGKVNPLCPTCYGTGFVQGYEGPIDIIIAPDDAERRVAQTPIGRRLEHNYEVWTSPSPMLSQRDFIVKQTGERYSIGPVRRPSNRGLPLQQFFSIAYLDEKDIRYQVPVTGVTELPWPGTRFTDQNTVAQPGDPHPVGFDYQATTMETEKEEIPDEREQRGRTPVWENITYAWPFFLLPYLWGAVGGGSWFV